MEKHGPLPFVRQGQKVDMWKIRLFPRAIPGDDGEVTPLSYHGHREALTCIKDISNSPALSSRLVILKSRGLSEKSFWLVSTDFGKVTEICPQLTPVRA
jgi:hypothetical protein